jgi:hypothetical protein
MNKQPWPFEEPRNVAAFSSTHIFRDGRPILYVTHDEEDGAWQFHSGSPTADSEVMIVALGEVLEHDSSIGQLADLPLGWSASRETPNNTWKRVPKAT